MKKKQHQATNEKPNMYINIFNKKTNISIDQANLDIHIWFLVCYVALFLLHFVIVYFDAHIKLWLYRSTLIQQQYLCQWLTSSTPLLIIPKYIFGFSLLCGVGSSSLFYRILRRPYQDFVSSTLIQQQYLCQWLTSSTCLLELLTFPLNCVYELSLSICGAEQG